MIGENDRAIADRTLDAARKAGAEQIDVLVASSIATAVGVADGALEEAERSERRDIGLRVLIGKRQACVSTSDDRDAALSEMAERAVAMARAAPEDAWCGLAGKDALGDRPKAGPLQLDDPGDFPDPAALEEQALAVEAAARDVDGVTQIEQASASWSRDTITLVQSNGFEGHYRRSSIMLACSALAGAGLGRERDYAFEQRRHATDLPGVEEVGRLAGRRAVERLSPRRARSGRYPVLYDQRVAGSLIAHMLAAINGGAIARGSSWLSEAMETRVLPEGFDVTEEPLLPRGRSSRPFDAEGVPARSRPIVEDGVLLRWLLDLSTARQLGLETTGNARRSVAGPPSPGPTNIRVTEGAHSRERLMREMGTGFLVTSMIGSSVNPTTGDYSRGASGFWVEDGEIAYPVNEATVAGSLPQMLKTLVPANDADPSKAISVPSLLVEGLTVGA